MVAAAGRAPVHLSPSRTRRCLALSHMDPVAEHQRIVRISGLYEFPWDTKRALEIALLRTFAVPRISGLLHRTGEFERRPQRRYDDTTILIAELVEHGYDSPRGRAAIARMNDMHGRHRIRDEDLLFVLSTFVFEPARWVDDYGWRPYTAVERVAGFTFWREVAARMRIRDPHGVLIDSTTFQRWSAGFERAEVRPARSNVRIARATLDLVLSWHLPRHVRHLGERAVTSLLDAHLLDAFALPHPTPAERHLVAAALRSRSAAMRQLPARRRPVLETRRRHRSRPTGYRIEDLGT
jgi:hypothetical protein